MYHSLLCKLAKWKSRYQELYHEIGPKKQNYDIKRFLSDLTEPGFEPIFHVKDLDTALKLQ